MSKKYITKTHLTDIDGELVAPGTEIEAARLGDAATIARYEKLEAVESGIIQTGEVNAPAENLDSAELLKSTRQELVEKAAAAGVEIAPDATKAQIVDALLAK